MPRITPERSLTITEHIRDCNVWRLTSEESAQYLSMRGFPIDVRTVKRYRAKIRLSASDWIASLAKSKRFEYLAEYKERVDEIRLVQRELWTINNKKNQGPADKIRIEALTKIMECTKILADLHDRVPVVAAIRDYNKEDNLEEVVLDK
jgi:hypothetical protein